MSTTTKIRTFGSHFSRSGTLSKSATYFQTQPMLKRARSSLDLQSMSRRELLTPPKSDDTIHGDPICVDPIFASSQSSCSSSEKNSSPSIGRVYRRKLSLPTILYHAQTQQLWRSEESSVRKARLSCTDSQLWKSCKHLKPVQEIYKHKASTHSMLSTPPSSPTTKSDAVPISECRSKSLSQRRGLKSMKIAMPINVENDEDSRDDTKSDAERDELFTVATRLMKHSESPTDSISSEIEDRALSNDWVALELMQCLESSCLVTV